jgi:hypothetical protein
LTCGVSMHGTNPYVMNKSIIDRCGPKFNVYGNIILIGEEKVSKASKRNHTRTWDHRNCYDNMYFPFRGKHGIAVVKQSNR